MEVVTEADERAFAAGKGAEDFVPLWELSVTVQEDKKLIC
jgi:hypothetical protein